MKLGQASAAFVYDTSVFGATAPVIGTRSRLDVTPLFGDLTFSELTADYRRYFAPVSPFTIAVRGLHIGRYGPDAGSDRINPLFLGYPTLVRGYDVGSFDGRECIAAASSSCPAFDQLVGSRLLVANAELRFPLVGAFRGNFDYGVLPIDGVVFADTGVAWTADDRPSFADGSRDFVSSVGVGLRVNTFGYLIAEIDAVRPFDRPDNGWQFLFSLKPGF
jgi:outer membrane protein assembly factor BamA